MEKVARKLSKKQAKRLERKKRRCELRLSEWRPGALPAEAKVMRLKLRARREVAEAIGQAFVCHDPYNRAFSITWG